MQWTQETEKWSPRLGFRKLIFEKEGIGGRGHLGWTFQVLHRAPDEPLGMKAENRTASHPVMLPADPECFPMSENNSPRSLDNTGERGQKGRMIFLRLH